MLKSSTVRAPDQYRRGAIERRPHRRVYFRSTGGLGTQQHPDPWDTPVLLTVPEACARLGGISRWKLYQEMNRLKLSFVHIGRRRFIPHDDLLVYVEQLRKEQQG